MQKKYVSESPVNFLFLNLNVISSAISEESKVTLVAI